MKKLLITIALVMGLATSAYSAELLVQAKAHWKDSFTQSDVSKLSATEKQSYEARSQIGDIIVVRGDGWKWGKEECLPNYVVVKVPDVKEADAKKYEASLNDETDPLNYKLIRTRKYAIPSSIIETSKKNKQSVITLEKSSFDSQLITKTGATTEVKAPSRNIFYAWYKKVSPYLNIAKTYWIDNAYAATQLLKTVKPSGGDYTSLEACMNANEQNLVTADKYFDVEIDGTWSSADTTAVTIHNYTTDATRYINIYTTTTARHKGVLSTSYYMLSVNSSRAIDGRVSNNSQDVRITGLQVVNASATGKGIDFGWSVANTGPAYIRYNLVVSTGSSNAPAITLYRATAYIYNNIIYGFSGSSWGVGITTYKDTAIYQYVYNNTIYGCYIGIKPQAGNQVAKNNICYNNGTDWVNGSGDGWGAASTNNLSKDNTAPAYNTYYRSKTLTFVNIGSGTEDLHLVAGDTDAIDKGADLSGESIFTDDIDGDTIPSGHWPIGADYPAGGAPPAGPVYIRDVFNSGIMKGILKGAR